VMNATWGRSEHLVVLPGESGGSSLHGFCWGYPCPIEFVFPRIEFVGTKSGDVDRI
jgi:hypothetical protein